MPFTQRHLILAALPALIQPPPDCHDYHQYVCSTLATVVQPPPDPVTDVRYRLFLGDMNAFGGRDIFTMFSKNRYHFYEMTGETPETFLQLLQILAVDITVLRSLRNRCLMFMIWLRHYPSYFFLSTLFDISVTRVNYIIRKLVPIFKRHLQAFFKWPTINEWGSMREA